MLLLGFRPGEFLSLISDSFNPENGVLVGGSKTAAGMNRLVPVPRKILHLVSARAAKGGHLYPAPDGTPWTLKSFSEKLFYPALDALGIDNPIVIVGGGVQRHKYTPHTCRHTFATLLKKIPGAERDKLELIGHTSGDMLRYYQDVTVEDLRAIMEAI